MGQVPDKSTGGTVILGVLWDVPWRKPWKYHMENLMAIHYVMVFIATPPLILWILVYTIFFTNYWWIWGFYLAFLAYDYHTPRQGGRPLDWFRRAQVWKHLRDYFPIGLVKTADLDTSKNYIIFLLATPTKFLDIETGIHPHGILSYGFFLNFGTEANEVSTLYPGMAFHPATLGGQFWMPGRREYCLCAGAIDVSRESIRYVLNRPLKGHVAVICVGGAREAYYTCHRNRTLILRNRKGFVKQALVNGADLVPAYSFGENDTYSQIHNPEGGLLRRIQERLKGLLGFSIPIFKGRGVFNFTYGIVPHRNPITTVVGAPIRVQKKLDPTAAEIDSVHRRYCWALSDIFEAHKKDYGFLPHETLNFV